MGDRGEGKTLSLLVEAEGTSFLKRYTDEIKMKA